MGWPGLAFVAWCVAGQFVPLVNVIGYEYSVWLAIGLTALGLARGVCCAAHDDLWTQVFEESRVLGAACLVGVAVSLLNSVRVPVCEPVVGLAFVGVFSAGAIPSIVALSAASRALTGSRRLRAAFAGGMVLGSLVSSVVYIATQPDITVYNPYVGYFAGSIYDEALVGFGAHVWFRAWCFAWAGVILCLLALRTQPRALERRWLPGLVLILGVMWWHRGDLGIEKSRAYVVSELGGFASTEHVDVVYDASAFSAERLALLLYDHEAEFAAQAAFWGTEPRHRVTSFVYGSREEKGRLMGGRRTLVAKIWLGEMHITWSGIGSTTLSHEMAHLFLREDGRGPLNLASSFGLVPIMALVEGAATAAGWGGGEWDEHYWSVAMRDEGFAEDLETLLGPVGFWSRYSSRAYTLTGSFARYLIDTYGVASFREAYGGGTFDEAYGRDLGALVAEWEAWLDTLERSEALGRAARWRFDRSSLFGRRCARSIATRMDEGDRLLRAGDREAATTCFEQVIADDPNHVGRRLEIAARWFRIGETERALRQVEWVLAQEGASSAERAQAEELRADQRWLAGDAAAASETYQRLADASGTERDARRLLAKAMATASARSHPQTSAAVARALIAVPAVPDAVVVSELEHAWRVEGQPLAAYLALLRLAGATETTRVEALFEGAMASADAGAALAPVQRRNAVRALAMYHTEHGQPEACATWGAARSASRVGTGLRAQSERWLARCARGSMPSIP